MRSLTREFSIFLVKMKEHVPFGVYGKGKVAGLSVIGYQLRFMGCSLTLNSSNFSLSVWRRKPLDSFYAFQ